MPLQPQPDTPAGQPAEQRVNFAATQDRLSLMDVWRVLVKRSFIILGITAVALAGAGIYSFRTKPVYESASRIEIKPNAPPNVGLESLVEEGRSAEGTALQTEILVLQSDTVLLETAESLDLISRIRAAAKPGNSAPAAPAQGMAGPQAMTGEERLTLINYIRGGLRVQILPGTQMVEIRYRNNDPRLSTEVVNRLVDTYVDKDLRSKYERTMHVSAWLQKQLEALKQEAADAQRRLADFQKQHNIVGSDETSNLTMQTLSQIGGDLESAEADRIMKEARMREYEKQDPDTVALMGDNPQLSTLRAQLADLETQRAQVTLKFGDRHPRMLELNAQIEKLKAGVQKEAALAREQARNEYEASRRLEDMERQRLDAQKEDAYRLNEDAAQYAILRHEAELNRDLYDTLQMRLKEASVTAGLSATNITVIDRAQIPTYAVAPRKSLNMMLALLGGLMAGTVFAFMAESLDDTLRTSEEVESMSSLSSLATVPHMADETPKRKRDAVEAAPSFQLQQLIALQNPKSMAAEAYRGLRSSLLLSSIDNPPRVIVFSSAFPGEGKTTTASNCAIAFAQRGERVLLVDADLRRGSLDKVFRFDRKRIGLSTVLARPAAPSDMPAPLPELPMLHVLITGPRPPNPAEMLSSHRMEEQLRQWTREFDRVVIDSAPVLAVSDTQALAAMADTVVLVARAGMTRKRALLRARDLLWRINARIAGVVVNDVDLRLENFYTYRYGMYGTRYGYGYQDTESDGGETAGQNEGGR